MKFAGMLFLFALVLTFSFVLTISPGCGDDDDDDDSGDDDDDTSGGDDDDDNDDDVDPTCTEEQTCWTTLKEALKSANTEQAFNDATNAYYQCLDTANGCTGQYLDCISECTDNDCYDGCNAVHSSCLVDNCGWKDKCYGSCFSNYYACDESCETEDWECKKDCFRGYTSCITTCW